MITVTAVYMIPLRIPLLVLVVGFTCYVAFRVIQSKRETLLEDYSNMLNCESQFICGGIHMDIRYPFRVEGEPEGCGDRDIQISCEHNHTVLYLQSLSRKYYVVPDSLNYRNARIRVTEPGIQKGNCSTLPLSSSPYLSYPLYPTKNFGTVIFVSCKNPVKSHLYVDTAPCLSPRDFTNTSFDKSESPSYSYAVVGEEVLASDIEENCTIYRINDLQLQSLGVSGERNISFQDIHNSMALAFELQWTTPFKIFSFFQKLVIMIPAGLYAMYIGGRAIIGLIPLLVFLIYKWRRRHLSVYDNIEEFLQNRNNLAPIRYSYKEVKKMTKSFKEKLGEGGYGSVYKGKLRSGQLVAVKMLTKSKANGQEFINEVATLGRIHHVNVVRLVGFSVTASKRALVYDYMANGSLEKFIFGDSPNVKPLSWKKTFEIATGIARGMEYLHQGCNMQILHFDIKPHNILLDENFLPKLSDFGLARLCPIQKSVVTLTAARGTLGYMAPELFYKRIGKVSYKADVYSFGMLLMEIAGRRRNVNAFAVHSSQIYFPSWIYDKFDQGEDVEIAASTTEEEKGIVRKLVLIALWCIQMTPDSRPSMREVLGMLEDNVESLQLPPKPHFYPPDSPTLEPRNSCSSSEESMEPLCRSVSLEIEEFN